MEAGPLTGKPGFSHGGQAALTGKLGSHREARPLTGSPGLAQGGQASKREAEPLKGRQGL